MVVDNILLIVKNVSIEKEAIMLTSVKVNMIKRFNFEDFVNWYIEIYEENHHYIKKFSFVGFRIVLKFSLSNSPFLKKIYPIFPWDINLKESLIKDKKYFYFHNKNELIDTRNIFTTTEHSISDFYNLENENKILKENLNKLNKEMGFLQDEILKLLNAFDKNDPEKITKFIEEIIKKK